jgi:transcriptional regulator with XRE-family HTH domain
MLPVMDAFRFGRVLRAVRRHLGLTQAAVARRAGISQSVYSRAECGDLTGMTVGTLDRIAASIGATLIVDIRYQGGLGDRLVDAAHAALVEIVVGVLRRHRWEVEVEFTFNFFGDRGSVDVLGWNPASRTLLIVEVKARFTDLQAMLVSLARKLRVVPDAAREERSWDATHVGRIVVAYGSAENRAVLARYASTFDAALPARANEIRRWLGRPEGPLSGVCLVSRDLIEFRPGWAR